MLSHNISRLGPPSTYDPNFVFLSDCAVCSKGYGRGIKNGCHSCENTKIWLLIGTGIVASSGILMLLILLAVFLIGGLDAVNSVLTSVTRNVHMSRKASKIGSVTQTSRTKRHYRNQGARKDFVNDIITPVLDITWESGHFTSNRDTGHSGGKLPRTSPGPDDGGRACVRPCSAVVRTGTSVVSLSNVSAGHASDVEIPARHHARQPPAAGTGVDGELVNEGETLITNGVGKSKGCGLAFNIKTWASRFPLHKFKILLVVWQILTIFSSITGVAFPESYALFLSWINVVNFDVGYVLSVSCVLPSVNFYATLLVTTLTPLFIAAGLALTYQVAKRTAGIGSAGVIARRAAWSRHMAAGLLLMFLVRFSSLQVTCWET